MERCEKTPNLVKVFTRTVEMLAPDRYFFTPELPEK
jgi:hypothetical protein